MIAYGYGYARYNEFTVTLPWICIALFMLATALWFYHRRFRELARQIELMNAKLTSKSDTCHRCKKKL